MIATGKSQHVIARSKEVSVSRTVNRNKMRTEMMNKPYQSRNIKWEREILRWWEYKRHTQPKQKLVIATLRLMLSMHRLKVGNILCVHASLETITFYKQFL